MSDLAAVLSQARYSLVSLSRNRHPLPGHHARLPAHPLRVGFWEDRHDDDFERRHDRARRLLLVLGTFTMCTLGIAAHLASGLQRELAPGASGSGLDAENVAVLVAWGIAGLAVAARAFRWELRLARG